jgi:molybdopterin-guanine dinucleotide biosynthesis protein A
MPSGSLAAIALAGGNSIRMGRDKALIPVQGVPLLRRICLVALECTPIVYVVTSRVHQYEKILPPECQVIQERLLPGEIELQGPLVGFAQGLENVQTEWVLLLACDLPNLRLEILQDWIMELDNQPDLVDALLPQGEKGWEPLCGFYRVSNLAHLTTFIQQGGRSFQRWLQQRSVKALPLSSSNMLFNCNTPADLTHVLNICR